VTPKIVTWDWVAAAIFRQSWIALSDRAVPSEQRRILIESGLKIANSQ
jgi:hypothetical protein